MADWRTFPVYRFSSIPSDRRTIRHLTINREGDFDCCRFSILSILGHDWAEKDENYHFVVFPPEIPSNPSDLSIDDKKVIDWRKDGNLCHKKNMCPGQKVQLKPNVRHSPTRFEGLLECIWGRKGFWYQGNWPPKPSKMSDISFC